MSYMSEKVERVLGALQRERTRCTYGALAEFIGARPRDVAAYLAPRRPEASWVVNKKTGMPTRYESFQIHPGLEMNQKVIERGADIKRLLA